MSFWLPSRAPWSLDPGLRREDDERDQRQLRALSFPLRKQGPRSRSGAAATGRTSAQQAFRRHSAGAHEKKAPSMLQKPWWLDVLLVATQCSVVPGSRPSPGKLWGSAAIVQPRSPLPHPPQALAAEEDGHHGGDEQQLQQGALADEVVAVEAAGGGDEAGDLVVGQQEGVGGADGGQQHQQGRVVAVAFG